MALTVFLTVGLAVPALTQPATTISTRETKLFLLAGQDLEVDTGWLEPGRPYSFEIELQSASAPANESWVEVRAESAALPVRARLDSFQDQYLFTATANRDRPIRLILTGGGDLGASYRLAVRWRGHPQTRMPGVTFIWSPHQNVRPPGAGVTAVVVHATVSPTLESTVNWFLAPESQVSAHYTVGKDGKIVQMVEDTERGWHAGVSELDGVRGVNDFSVGIEIVNLNDGIDPYTDAQYESVAEIIRHLREQFHLPDSRIVSHEHVARPPGRKSDPKGFDFQRLFGMLRAR